MTKHNFNRTFSWKIELNRLYELNIMTDKTELDPKDVIVRQCHPPNVITLGMLI